LMNNTDANGLSSDVYLMPIFVLTFFLYPKQEAQSFRYK
jgi:hypothetical protein